MSCCVDIKFQHSTLYAVQSITEIYSGSVKVSGVEVSSVTLRPKKLSVTPALACGTSVARRGSSRRSNPKCAWRLLRSQ